MRLASAAAEWAGSERVQVGRWSVRYREAGAGPTVVLVHGLGVSADYWFRNGPTLAAAGFRVLAPDLPGFGRTEGPDDGLTVPEQVDALREWVASLALGPALFVGHSLSCQTVLRLAAESPDLVTGLVLAAPTGADGPHRRWRQAFGLLIDAWREPWALIPVVTAAYLRTGPFRYWKTWKAGAVDSPLEIVTNIHAPSLVVVGSRDPVVKEENARLLADNLPNGEMKIIPGAAHAVIFDRSGEFNSTVIAFARKNG